MPRVAGNGPSLGGLLKFGGGRRDYMPDGYPNLLGIQGVRAAVEKHFSSRIPARYGNG